MTKAIVTLNKMIFADLCARNPEIRPELMDGVGKMKAGTANELTKAIIKFIQLSGGQAERISVTGRRVDQTKIVTDVLGFKRQIGSVKWIKSSMTKGSADISATIRGRSVKIEVKVGRDKIRPEQETYRDQVQRAGGTYIIATDLDQFLAWYNEFVGSI